MVSHRRFELLPVRAAWIECGAIHYSDFSGALFSKFPMHSAYSPRRMPSKSRWRYLKDSIAGHSIEVSSVGDALDLGAQPKAHVAERAIFRV
jgi:hypothetical protein